MVIEVIVSQAHGKVHHTSSRKSNVRDSVGTTVPAYTASFDCLPTDHEEPA